jgi:hypothetical protein
MRSSVRVSASGALVAAFLAGATGSPASAAAHGAPLRAASAPSRPDGNAPARSWFAPGWSQAIAAGTDVVYLAEYATGTINIYSTKTKVAPTAPIGQITGLVQPEGIAVDSHRNLYVAEETNNDVKVFKPGTTTPTRILTGLDAPLSVSVNRAGTVVVTNYLSDSISVFAKGSLTPTQTLHTPHQNQPDYAAIDDAGDVVIPCYFGNEYSFDVGEFVAGSDTLTELAVDFGGRPQGVSFDSAGDLLILDRDAGLQIYPPGQSTASQTLPIFAYEVALTKNDAYLYTASNGDFMDRYTYPGGVFDYQVNDPAQAHYGVATSPAAPLGTWHS